MLLYFTSFALIFFLAIRMVGGALPIAILVAVIISNQLVFYITVTFIHDKYIIVECGQGYCHHCSYNLTGIDSERCPECGQRIEKLGTRL